MPGILARIISQTDYLPFIIFGSLILSGFNIPISEDIIIISSAILAEADNGLLFPLYIAIYAGVLISDHIAYWIGTRMRHGFSDNSFLRKKRSQKVIFLIQKYLHNHGVLTFIFCRFIPFGVRNTLFMSSGFTGMSYRLFTIYDLIAVSINTSVLYFLIYFLGISIERPFKIIGVVLFAIFVFTLAIILYRVIKRARELHSREE